MRNISFLLFLFCTALLISCGPTVEEGIKYSDDIIEQNSIIQEKITKLVETYDQFVPEQMDAAYAKALEVTDSGLHFANKLLPFDEDSTFKEGAIKLFSVYKEVLNTEHRRIIELLKLPEEDYKEEEIEEFAKLIETSHGKIDKATNELIKIQEDFAKAHKFKVETE